MKAYGSEPVLLAASPVTQPRHKARRFGKWWAVVVAVCFLAAVGSFVAWRAMAKDSFVPAAVAESVDFTLYVPAGLPSGFRLEEGSVKGTSQVVTYSVNYGDGQRLVVSQQPKPPGFDFAAFHDQFEDKKSVSVAAGDAAMGNFEDADLASLVAGKTWILVRAPSGIGQQQMQEFLNSLSPLH